MPRREATGARARRLRLRSRVQQGCHACCLHVEPGCEVVMPWEGEAGLVCGMEGTHAAWGSSPLAPGGLLHILLCLGDLKGLEVSVL